MSEAPPPVPRPVGAVTLTLLAWATATVFWAPLVTAVGHWVALAVGLVAGYGGVGTLAARTVPPPAEERIGLHGFAPVHVPTLLLLLPAVLLASEIDNWVRPLVPALPAPEGAAPPAPGADVLPYLAIEYAIASVLLRPVLEEFFFRGVIQQGVVEALGRARGVALTTFCFALAAAGFALPTGPERAASAAAQALFLGPLLGVLRLATGSVLAPMMAQIGLAVVGTVAAASPELLSIPGFNAEGDHTPLAWLLPAALSVAVAVLLCVRHRPEARLRTD